MANKNLLVAGVAYASCLTTELNSLADATFSALGSAIVNSSNLNLYADFSIVLASLNPTGSPFLEIHLAELGGDGSNYDDLSNGTWVGNIVVTTGSSAKYGTLKRVPLTLGSFKPALKPRCNVSLASSGSTLYYRTYSEQNNG